MLIYIDIDYSKTIIETNGDTEIFWYFDEIMFLVPKLGKFNINLFLYQ